MERPQLRETLSQILKLHKNEAETAYEEEASILQIGFIKKEAGEAQIEMEAEEADAVLPNNKVANAWDRVQISR